MLPIATLFMILEPPTCTLCILYVVGHISTLSLSACVYILCAWREDGVMPGLSATDTDSWKKILRSLQVNFVPEFLGQRPVSQVPWYGAQTRHETGRYWISIVCSPTAYSLRYQQHPVECHQLLLSSCIHYWQAHLFFSIRLSTAVPEPPYACFTLFQTCLFHFFFS